jgi:hypothetical protein
MTSSPGLVLFFDIARGPSVMGMSPRWIRQEIRRGMPHLKTAGKILLDPIKVRAWMEINYTPTPVDLQAAHELAEQLTAGRRQRKERTR